MNILEKQSNLIESQRKLFLETVRQFEKDLIFLNGCLAIAHSELQHNGELSNQSVQFMQFHLSEMQSMLNDFNARLANNERD